MPEAWAPRWCCLRAVSVCAELLFVSKYQISCQPGVLFCMMTASLRPYVSASALGQKVAKVSSALKLAEFALPSVTRMHIAPEPPSWQPACLAVGHCCLSWTRVGAQACAVRPASLRQGFRGSIMRIVSTINQLSGLGSLVTYVGVAAAGGMRASIDSLRQFGH